MKKFWVTLAVGGCLLAPALKSQAVIFVISVPSATSTTTNDFTTGINSSAGNFTSTLAQAAPDIVGDKSVVGYGDITQKFNGSGTVNNESYSNAPANYTIDVQEFDNTGTTLLGMASFIVNGNIVGNSSFSGGIGSTNGDYRVSTITLDGPGGFSSTETTNIPTPGGVSAIIIRNVVIGTDTINLYVETNNQLPIPYSTGVPNTSTVGGFIETSVPEPGTLALLIGSSMGGTLLLRRRRA